jgi:hypothetical protein
MVSVFIALLAFTNPPNPPPDPAALDLQCYRLMAQLAQDEDPRISDAGLTGAQYFLGRIDASSPGFDPASVSTELTDQGVSQSGLIEQCGALMGAGGRNFRAIGQSLAAKRDTI